MSDFFLYKMSHPILSDPDDPDHYWVLFESGRIRHPLVVISDYQMRDIVRQYEEQKENKKKPKKGRE